MTYDMRGTHLPQRGRTQRLRACCSRVRLSITMILVSREQVSSTISIDGRVHRQNRSFEHSPAFQRGPCLVACSRLFSAIVHIHVSHCCCKKCHFSGLLAALNERRLNDKARNHSVNAVLIRQRKLRTRKHPAILTKELR